MQKVYRKQIQIALLLCCMLVLPCRGFAGGGKIALVMKALSNPFFAKMESGAKEYAATANVTLDVFGIERETDVERQISIMDKLIAQGEYGAIVIAPADSIELLPVCKKAVEKGLIVINIDNPFHEETMKRMGLEIPFVGSDNRLGAGMVGNYILRKLGGQGRVMVIEGIGGVANADLRKAGFIDSLEAGEQIEIVASESANWHMDEAFSLVTKLWGQYGPVDAIVCANDNMALGAVQALELLDTKGQRPWIGAYDNIDAVRDEMRHGRIHATVEQHPSLMGQFGVELAAKALRGERISQNVSTPLDLITYESFDKKIGLSISELKNPFFVSLLRGAREAADLFGVQLVVSDAMNDDAQQLADLHRFAEHKSDLVILNPTSGEAVLPGIEMLNAAQIPVITVDRNVSGGKVACLVASDNVAGGRMAGEVVVRSLSGRGKVVELEGIPGTSAAHERGMGFNEVLNRYPEMSIVAREVGNFDRQSARAVAERLLRKGVNFDAVFAHNDNMILGFLDALEASPISHPIVLLGFDGTKEGLEAVREGKIAATIAQQPRTMGYAAVQSAARLLRGEPLSQVIPIEIELIEGR